MRWAPSACPGRVAVGAVCLALVAGIDSHTSTPAGEVCESIAVIAAPGLPLCTNACTPQGCIYATLNSHKGHGVVTCTCDIGIGPPFVCRKVGWCAIDEAWELVGNCAGDCGTACNYYVDDEDFGAGFCD